MGPNEVIQNFFPEIEIKSVEPFGNGHINSTYKVVLSNSQQYILQKINTQVFTNPYNIIQNHLLIQNSISSDYIEVPRLLKNASGKYFFVDSESNVWRMMNFIKDSYSVEVVENNTQAFEAGKGFGWFFKVCSLLNPAEFNEAIKDFHNIQFRYQQLNEAIKKNKVKRLSEVTDLVKFYKWKEEELSIVQNLVMIDEIPTRVVHNDTKVNNLLFRDDKAIAVIDLDTVGPGSVLFDYGDAIRTITNTAVEDERNLSKVDFNFATFESFTKGYLEQAKSVLTKKEKETLYIAPFYMTTIMGIRFLTDYLNGDIYYKTKYAEHNLIRSLVQKTLIEKMDSNLNEIKNIITNLIN